MRLNNKQKIRNDFAGENRKTYEHLLIAHSHIWQGELK